MPQQKTRDPVIFAGHPGCSKIVVGTEKLREPRTDRGGVVLKSQHVLGFKAFRQVQDRVAVQVAVAPRTGLKTARLSDMLEGEHAVAKEGKAQKRR
jgi:hypothetical protein